MLVSSSLMRIGYADTSATKGGSRVVIFRVFAAKDEKDERSSYVLIKDIILIRHRIDKVSPITSCATVDTRSFPRNIILYIMVGGN